MAARPARCRDKGESSRPGLALGRIRKDRQKGYFNIKSPGPHRLFRCAEKWSLPARKAMKLLLLQPPIQDFYDTDIRLQPIGLCYLKAAVQKYLPEVQVIIKDYHQGWGRRPIPIPKALAYLKEFYPWPDKSPFATFYHYYHFGAGFDALAADVAAEQADLVGISALFTPYYREVLQCADAINKHLNVPILVGGAHVSAAPLTVLSHPGGDFIIRGEGERPLVEFLSAWQGGQPLDSVPSLGFKIVC